MKYLIIGLLLAYGSVSAEKIAIVHFSGERAAKAQAAEFKDHEVELVIETEIDKLTPRLKEFDAVIYGTLAGHYKPVDWEKNAAPWKEYLEQGGVLLVLDANYDNTLREIFGRWGSEWNLKVKHCKQYTDDFQKLTRHEFRRDETLAMFPYEIKEPLEKIRIWNHYTEPSGGWTAFGRCPDGNTPLVYRFAGRGMVIAGTAGGFGGDRVKCWYQLLMNGIINNRLRNMNVEINRFHMPCSFGERELLFGIKSRNRNHLQGTVKLSLDDRVLVNETLDMHKPGDWSFPYNLDKTGNLRVEIIINDGTRKVDITRESAVIAPVTAEPLFVSYRPSIMKCAPFRITLDNALGQLDISLLVDGKAYDNIRIGHFPAPTILDLSALSAGKHQIEAVAARADGGVIYRTPPQFFEVAAADPETMIDSEGFMMHAGKRIFPRGFYSNSVRADELQLIKDTGYQFIHTGAWTEDASRELPKMFDALEKLGLKAIVAGQAWLIGERVRNSPALLAWDVVDEPDYHGLSPDACKEQAARMRSMGEKPVYMVLAQPRSLDGSYFTSTDIVAHDSYPIPGQAIDAVHRDLKMLVDNLAGYGRMPWGVLQCFGYPGNKTGFGVVPSAVEFRNMAYQAITAGVKGISLYVYRDSNFDVDQWPELKAATCASLAS